MGIIDIDGEGTTTTTTTTTTTATTTISCLPFEIWAKILSYLSLRDLLQLRCVSRSFSILAHMPCLTREVDFRTSQRMAPTTRQLRSFFVSATELRHLVLHDDGLPPYVLRLIAQYCGNLESLTLDGFTQMTDGEITAVARGCPKLQRFEAPRAIAITARGLVSLAENCPHLTAIDFSDHYFLVDEMADAIGRTLGPRLESLNLASCMGLSREAITNLVSRCTKLRKLFLDSCSVTDATLLKLPEDTPMIELSIKRCNAVTCTGLAHVGRVCRHLTRLDMYGVRVASDAVVSEIFKHNPLLEAVDISWCLRLTDESVNALVGCNRLRRLCLTGCDQVSWVAVTRVARAATYLKHLDLSWNPRISDGGLAHIAINLRCLRSLYLNWCRQLTATAIKTVAWMSRHGALKSFIAVGCDFDESDAVLESLFPPTCNPIFR